MQPLESVEKAGQLRQAIGSNDLTRVQELLTANPGLRQVLIDDVPLQRVAHPGRIAMMVTCPPKSLPGIIWKAP